MILHNLSVDSMGQQYLHCGVVWSCAVLRVDIDRMRRLVGRRIILFMVYFFHCILAL